MGNSDKTVLKGDINLKLLKSKIKWGQIKTIAKKVGLTPQAVSQQLNGKTDVVREDLINAVIAVINETKEKKKELNKLIKQA